MHAIRASTDKESRRDLFSEGPGEPPFLMRQEDSIFFLNSGMVGAKEIS